MTQRYVLLILLPLLLSGSSCRNSCKQVICEHDGTCNEGLCVCLPGYEGEDCGKEVREKFLGTFSVFDECSAAGYGSYAVTVDASDVNINTVVIHGLKELFENPVIATVNGNRIIISTQSPDNNFLRISGKGVCSNGVISWEYTVTDDFGLQDVCKSNWTAR